jgi:hypothetical protein
MLSFLTLNVIVRTRLARSLCRTKFHKVGIRAGGTDPRVKKFVLGRISISQVDGRYYIQDLPLLTFFLFLQ